MYAESRVRARLALAASEFGVTPEPHTPEEVDEFEKYLVKNNKYVYNNLGAPESTQNLTDFDRAWMLNEQLLVLCDASYCLTRYCYIKNEQNIIERFRFRVPQRLLFNILCDLEASSRTLEVMILKARQLGMSSLIELLIAHRIIFAYGANAIIGSADQTKTGLMVNMLFLAYDLMPVWLKPKPTRRVESERGMLVFGTNSSGVSFQHGSQMSGIARGTTPTIYHLSEVASFTDAEDQIESSLFRCVHPSPSVFGILESSGEGDKGWWPDTWRSSRDNWSRDGARLCPLFLPWFCGIEMYPTRQWILHDHPIPPRWTPNRDTQLHVAKCELYVRATPLLARALSPSGQPWHMPPEQQWYWEFGHEEAKRKGTQAKWYQEMCSDDEDALQRSVVSAFGHDTIIELDALRERRYDIYGLSGQSIEDAHEVLPDYIDYSRERIPVQYKNHQNITYRWELIPLQHLENLRENAAEDVEGVLVVFHPPRPNINYSIGVDTSEGKGEDSTVISVWALGYSGLPDVQVAEFSSSHVNHVEAFAFTMCISAYYAQFMELGITRWPEPYVSIEQVAAVGDTCQFQMSKMGYHNFHRMGRYDRRDVAKSKQNSNQRGWFTHGWSRPILTGNFVHAAQNNWAQVNSPWLIEEMKDWEVHKTRDGKPRLEHSERSHDDRIFAAAMAIFCPHDLEKLSERSKKRLTEAFALPPVDLAPSAPGLVINSRDLAESRTLTLQDILFGDTSTLRRYNY